MDDLLLSAKRQDELFLAAQVLASVAAEMGMALNDRKSKMLQMGATGGAQWVGGKQMGGGAGI